MFQVNDEVFINNSDSALYGSRGTVISIDSTQAYPFQVKIDGAQFAFQYPEKELASYPPVATAQGGESYGFGQSGLGIGGLGRYIEPVIIPTIEAAKRLEQMERQARTCRQCGQSDIFDGAMFTTDPRSGLCDDCCY